MPESLDPKRHGGIFGAISKRLLPHSEKERHERRRQLRDERAELREKGRDLRVSTRRKAGSIAAQPSTLIATAATGFALTAMRGKRSARTSGSKAFNLLTLATRFI